MKMAQSATMPITVSTPITGRRTGIHESSPLLKALSRSNVEILFNYFMKILRFPWLIEKIPHNYGSFQIVWNSKIGHSLSARR